MEFIHSCAPTSIILTNLTGRLTECWTLFMSPTFCPSLPPSIPNEYPDPPPALEVSLHVCVCDMREDVHALTWISSFIIHLRAFLICLQVRRRKHVLRFSLNPTIIFIQSCAAHYLMVHRNSLMPTVEIGFTRHHTHKEETETEKECNRCQLSSSLYRDYLKFFAY